MGCRLLSKPLRTPKHRPPTRALQPSGLTDRQSRTPPPRLHRMSLDSTRPAAPLQRGTKLTSFNVLRQRKIGQVTVEQRKVPPTSLRLSCVCSARRMAKTALNTHKYLMEARAEAALILASPG